MDIILICVFMCSNALFTFIGYKLAKGKEVITIQKGDTVSYVKNTYKDFDEEASFVTPEMELEYEAELREQFKNELIEKGEL